jgi:microcystin degradation protein MlrC
VSFRTYPHIDGYERAVQAAALVQAAMDGKKKPRCLLVQPAMLEGADHGRTTQPGLMRDLLAKADATRRSRASTWSASRRASPGRHSLYRPVDRGEPRAGAEARAAAIARELIDEIWRRRDESSSDYRRSPTALPRRAPRRDKQGRW